MEATNLETIAPKAVPEWRVYSGRRVVLYARVGSGSRARFRSVLREAERALMQLERLVGPVSVASGKSIHLYYPIDGEANAPGPLGTDAVVCVVPPGDPHNPVALALSRSLLAQQVGTYELAARLFADGIAGVVASRCGGLPVREADDWARSEFAANRNWSLLAHKALEGSDSTAGYPRGETSFVAYLARSYGAGALRKVIAGYEPQRPDLAVIEAYGKPLGALEEDWRASLRRAKKRKAPFLPLLEHVVELIRPFWVRQVEIFLYMLIGIAYGLAMPLASKYLLDTAIPSGNLVHLLTFILILLGVYLLNTLVGLRRAYAATWLNSNILIRLQERMFSHLQGLSHRFYTNAKVGDLLTRLTSDLQIVQGAMSAIVNVSLYSILGALGAAIALFVLSPLLTSLLVVVVPLFALGYFTLRSRLQEAGYRRQQLGAEVTSSVEENLISHAVIKAFGLEERAVERYRGQLHTLFGSTLRLVTLGALFDMSTSLAVTLGQLLVFGVGGYLAMQGEISMGTLFAFFGLLPSLFAPIGAMAGLGQTVQTASGSLERVKELLDEPVEVKDIPGAVLLPQLERDIRLEEVSFSYGDRVVLRNLNITIRAGTHVAIVGPSGSGKSTLGALLGRYWDPDEGRVLYDRLDLREVTLKSLRGQIGLVLQETSIFDTTVRENIALGKPGATETEIRRAARMARIEEYIAQLPAGFDTILGERGVRMSGGQRQRLAIARALIRDPRILILDEATSALDAQTEREILDTLAEVARGRTTISITHRLAFAARADSVLVLSGGELVEEGSPAELLAAGGEYARLYSEQLARSKGENNQGTPAAPRQGSVPCTPL